MKRLSNLSAVLLGVMFLVSAFAKAWDADTFARMLLQYGPEWFGIWAPVIIFCEVFLGMCLLLRLRPRRAALAADMFLLTVSAVFAYGVLAKGIEDCGCFGALERYYTAKPWVTFVRNAVFMGMTIPVIITPPEAEKNLTRKLIAMMVVASAACFICGLAMKSSFRLPRLQSSEREDRTEMIAQLERIYPFSADSTYMVYLFSYTCPHCQNSFANVLQFEQFGIADKVIGIAIEDEEAQARFERIYQPAIEIRTIPNDSMSAITHELPLAVLIEGDSISEIQGGLIPSPGIFMK